LNAFAIQTRLNISLPPDYHSKTSDSNYTLGFRSCAYRSLHVQSINQSNLRLFIPPLTQTQRGLQEHKRVRKQNKLVVSR